MTRTPDSILRQALLIEQDMLDGESNWPVEVTCERLLADAEGELEVVEERR